ncbi:MAG TPA: SRPBCC domain-containing protein, partial [Methylomirabilota bacterium]|nr:SRPBCC domain-containing protein [Methylomirabilota bacterium]
LPSTSRRVENRTQEEDGMPDTEETVSLIRTIKAPAQQVFTAWTDGARLQRWLAPIAQADGRVGGRFRLEVQTTDGAHVVTGEYRELVPARRVVMSWVYEGPMVATGKVPTTVTVELRPSGANTEVSLRHEGLKDPTYRDTIRQGAWTEALTKLDSLLAAA